MGEAVAYQKNKLVFRNVAGLCFIVILPIHDVLGLVRPFQAENLGHVNGIFTVPFAIVCVRRCRRLALGFYLEVNRVRTKMLVADICVDGPEFLFAQEFCLRPSAVKYFINQIVDLR